MHDLYFSDWPCYEPDEIAAVTRVLESGKVNYWNGEDGRQKAEDGGLKTEYRGRRAEFFLGGLSDILKKAIIILNVFFGVMGRMPWDD